MLMAIKDFLAPTRGRILLFIIIFMMVFVYDTAFAPFPGSPVVDNLATQDGAMSFVLYILLLPYILSCLLPAFFGLRKRKFLRMATLMDFMHPRPEVHEQKPQKQQTFVFPQGTPVESSKPPAKDALDEVEDSGTPKSNPVTQKKPAAKPAKKPVKKHLPI